MIRWSFGKFAGMSVFPPPAWLGSWLAPASGGFQRWKPYVARSAAVEALLQCHLPLYTTLKPAADMTVATLFRFTGSSTCGLTQGSVMLSSRVYLTQCW